MHDRHQIRMLRVDGLEHRGHVEFDFDAIAVLPGAVEPCELARCGTGLHALAVDGDRGFGAGPGGDAQVDRKRAGLVG